MRTRVSTKGQIVLPGELRRRLGIRPGDQFEVRVEGEAIILTPSGSLPAPVAVATDVLTGLPVLSAPEDAPALTSQDVAALLSNFP